MSLGYSIVSVCVFIDHPVLNIHIHIYLQIHSYLWAIVEGPNKVSITTVHICSNTRGKIMIIIYYMAVCTISQEQWYLYSFMVIVKLHVSIYIIRYLMYNLIIILYIQGCIYVLSVLFKRVTFLLLWWVAPKWEIGCSYFHLLPVTIYSVKLICSSSPWYYIRVHDI